MSAVTAWPGFVPVTDPRQTRQMAEQLADDFGEVTFEGGERLSDQQIAEYNRLTLAQAQRHGQRADALERHATAHRARGERLAEQGAATETTIAFGAGGPELVERKAPAVSPADTRLTLAEAATRAGLDIGMVLASLGVPDEDGYLISDVDRLAQDR